MSYGEPLVHRSVTFEDFRPKEKLIGCKLRTISDIPIRKCGAVCLQTPTCLSFNYLKPRHCELNSGDVFTEGSTTVDDPLSVYLGMRKHQFPKCFEKGSPKDIQNDTLPNFCQINQKRVDATWGHWTKNWTLVTKDEWLREKIRKCHISLHGGKQLCTKDETEKTIIGLDMFFHEKKFFNDAKTDCFKLDATLFQDVCSDDSRDTLEFFNKILKSPDCFWVGVWYQNETWKTLDGNVVPMTCESWGPGQPNMFTSFPETVAAGLMKAGPQEFWYMHDVSDKNQCVVVCSKNLQKTMT